MRVPEISGKGYFFGRQSPARVDFHTGDREGVAFKGKEQAYAYPNLNNTEGGGGGAFCIATSFVIQNVVIEIKKYLRGYDTSPELLEHVFKHDKISQLVSLVISFQFIFSFSFVLFRL